MPKISVIIPTYFISEKQNSIFLKRCLKSFAEQTFKDFEVLLIQDGKNEDYYRLLNGFVGNDISVIQINKSGPAGCLNQGIKLAKGELIVFSDHDDWQTKNKIEKLFNIIGDYKWACGRYFITKTNKTRGQSALKVYNRFWNKNSAISPTHLGSTIIRRDVLLDLGGFPNVWAYDVYMTLLLSLLYEKAPFLDVVLYNWCQNDFSYSFNRANIDRKVKVIKDLFLGNKELLSTKDVKKITNKFLSDLK